MMSLGCFGIDAMEVEEEVRRIVEQGKELHDSATSFVSSSSHEELSLRQRSSLVEASITRLHSTLLSDKHHDPKLLDKLEEDLQRARCMLADGDTSSFLPSKPQGRFVRMFLGPVNVRASRKDIQLKVKEEYNSYRVSITFNVFNAESICQVMCHLSGPIMLGISENATVDEALHTRRRRKHREDLLNKVEGELRKLSVSLDEDVVLWKHGDGKYLRKFSTKKTWEQVRIVNEVCPWSKGVWFSQSTPKYGFLMSVALKGRLQTTDRMQIWNPSINTTCVLCNEEQESCSHLFFCCKFSGQIWRNLVEGLMRDTFTLVWDELIDIVSKIWLSPIKTFLLRYTLQAAVHTVWWERNSRRHGEKPRDIVCLTKMVDKNVRLKLLSIRRQEHF